MKDPLRDNRIFPEEMQQKPSKEQPKNYASALFTILIVIVALILGYLGYKTYQASLSDTEEMTEEERFEEELGAFQAIKENQQPLTQEERAQKINELFNGESN